MQVLFALGAPSVLLGVGSSAGAQDKSGGHMLWGLEASMRQLRRDKNPLGGEVLNRAARVAGAALNGALPRTHLELLAAAQENLQGRGWGKGADA